MTRPLRAAAPGTPETQHVAPINESHYAMKMRQLAKKERRKGRAPANGSGGHPKISDINGAILHLIDGEMSAGELAPLVSKHLGRKIKTADVTGKLRGHLLNTNQVSFREVKPRKFVWWKI